MATIPVARPLPQMRFPEGRLLACTTSWDDGRAHDRRVVEILNRHGLKGTFNLNSARLAGGAVADPRGPFVEAREVAALYAGHEVAVHSVSHPWPDRIPPQAWLRELIDDRACLEDLVQYPVRGAAWPFGCFDQAAVAMLHAAGLVHGRTTRSHGGFHLPAAGSWGTWDPTCHHRGLGWPPDGSTDRLWESFATIDREAWRRTPRLFYLWSHSYELPDHDGWAWFEAWAARAGACPGVWHATNIAIHDYVEAWRRLVFTWDGRHAFNPSAATVWVALGERTVAVPAGATVALEG